MILKARKKDLKVSIRRDMQLALEKKIRKVSNPLDLQEIGPALRYNVQNRRTVPFPSHPVNISLPRNLEVSRM